MFGGVQETLFPTPAVPTLMIWTGGGLIVALFSLLAFIVRRGRHSRRAHARPVPMFRT